MVGAVAAPAGCLLPWETVTVDAAGPGGVTHLDALHGAGVLACAGACVALLALALRVALPARSRLRDGFEVLGGALLVLGAALFAVTGGYRPGSGDGWSVRIAPGLVVAGAAGIVLLAAQAVSVIAAAGSDEATFLR
ncbi:MAG TPA: hypothetical protein VF112_02690 [Candidatus Dormibacteraeota bacterium]